MRGADKAVIYAATRRPRIGRRYYEITTGTVGRNGATLTNIGGGKLLIKGRLYTLPRPRPGSTPGQLGRTLAAG